MPWGENLGELPRLRPVGGAALVSMVIGTRVHHIVGADELEDRGPLADAWHDFADLMRDLGDSAADLDDDARSTLTDQLDALIRSLRDRGVKVVAGEAGGVLYVAVVRRAQQRELLVMFARS